MQKLRVHAQEADSKEIVGTRVVSHIAVTVSTKDVLLAGTDAHVFLRLGSLGDYPLITVGEDDFERGETRIYLLETNFTLASLRSEKIEIGHDNTGNLPGWFVSGLAIHVRFTGSNMLALYKEWGEIGWLSLDVEPFTTIAELQDSVR